GLSCFTGGLRNGTQKFNRTSAGSATVMLFLASVALVMPAVVAVFSFGSLSAHPLIVARLRFWTSPVPPGVYAAGPIFAFRWQRDPLRGDPGHVAGPRVNVAAALTLLAGATVFTTVEAEVLVKALEPALSGLGMTELFAGVIVVALVGNAAEHY